MPRKRVAQGVLDNVPEIGENQRIVKMLLPKGGHLYEVLLEDGEKTICRMPPKFRNLVWVKRGDYLVIEINASNTKVAGDILQILYPDQIKYLKKESKWPTRFEVADAEEAQAEDKEKAAPEAGAKSKGAVTGDTRGKARKEQDGEDVEGSDEEEEDQDDELFVNPNRRVIEDLSSEEEQE